MKTKKNFVSAIMVVASCLGLTWFTQAQTCPGSPGCLDPTFGAGGVTVTSPPSQSLGAREIDSVLQSNGQLVSLLYVKQGTSNTGSIVRLLANGNIDATFGSGGFRDLAWSSSSGAFARTISIQTVQTPYGPEERFIIAGYASCGKNSSCMRVERYTNAGVLDTTFGTNGIVQTSITATAPTSAVQSDKKILIASANKIVRFNATGSIDNSFGKSGLVTASSSFYFRQLQVLQDGKIVASGDNVSGSARDFVVARFNINGSLDDGGRTDSTPGNTFGSGGKTILNIGASDYAYGIIIDSNNRILLAGEAQIGGSTPQYSDAVIARFTAGGQLDTSFGTGGKTVLDIANRQDKYVAIAVQADGKIVAFGEGRDPVNDADYLVARYDSSGNLDSTFGTGGWRLHDFFGGRDTGQNLFIQADPDCGGCAKLITAGAIGDAATPWYLGVMRLII